MVRRHPHGIILTPTQQELSGRIAYRRSTGDARRTAWQGRTPSATSVVRVLRRRRSCGTGLREPAGGIRLRVGRGRQVGAPAAVRAFRAGRAVAVRPRAGYPSDAPRCVCAARSDTRWCCVRDVWAVPELAETVDCWVPSRQVPATHGPSLALVRGTVRGKSTSEHTCAPAPSASLAIHFPVGSGSTDHTHHPMSVLGTAHGMRGPGVPVRGVRRCPRPCAHRQEHPQRRDTAPAGESSAIHTSDAGSSQTAITTRHRRVRRRPSAVWCRGVRPRSAFSPPCGRLAIRSRCFVAPPLGRLPVRAGRVEHRRGLGGRWSHRPHGPAPTGWSQWLWRYRTAQTKRDHNS